MLWADRPSLAVRRACLIAYWILIYGLTHWPEIDRLVFGGEWLPPDADKLIHTGLYGGWAALWWWLLAHNGRRVGKAAIGWILVGGATYGIFDELTQAIVARRPDIWDWSCDMAGVVLACVVLHLWQKRQPLTGHLSK